MKIDLVYLWCSNTEEKYHERLNKAKQEFMIVEDKYKPDTRSTDHNELRYSLRSVEQFAPWIHHIYIVTSGQKPEWLDLNHPKITIVDDSEIVPKEYLPTFNSNIIEAFLHKIPGLSEHFLYACDDMFFTNKTEPDFFYTQDGKPIHYVAYLEKYPIKSYFTQILDRSRKMAERDSHRKIPSPVMPSHNIDPYTKSLYADTVNHFYSQYQEMFPNKFRRNNDVQRFLVSCWGYLTEQLVWKKVDFNKLAYMEEANPKVLENLLSTHRPNLFCINDSNMLDEEDYKYQANLLQSLFPNKSSFEQNANLAVFDYKFGLKPAFNKNNMPIVFVINERYLPFCIVTIQSILNNISPDYNYDLIIFADRVSDTLFEIFHTDQLPTNVSIRIVRLYNDNICRKSPLKMMSNERLIKWIKIFLPTLLPHYSKVIYLDVDTLVKCDIAELWNMDLDGKAVGGVTDMATHHIDSPKEEHMKKFFHCDNIDDYINLGVMVMDLDMLRKFNFIQKAMGLIANIPEKVWNLHDIFNIVLHKNIQLLPMKYNFQYGILYKGDNLYPFFKDEHYLAFQKTKLEGPKIVHFTAIKPWLKITGEEGINWWKLAKTTDFYEMISLYSKEIIPPQKNQKKQ